MPLPAVAAGGIIPAYAGSTLSDPGYPGCGGGGGIIPAYAGSTRAGSSTPAPPSDHPRIRGEHPLTASRSIKRCGSSPHTRGAPGRRLALELSIGIIPAYAGSTGAFPHRAWRSTDHPRIRGEHPSGAPRKNPVAGSSPHTRGAPGHDRPAAHPQGIIPAYAGSTCL